MVVAALPAVTIFFWLCLIYGWEAWGNLAPWLNSDEFERAQLSRAVAATGHAAARGVAQPFDSLYVYVLAPAWRIHDTSRAYGVAKATGVVTMTSVLFPTYLLARMLVSRPWALFAAAGAAMIPALAYSEMLLLEPLAYPWAALCFYVVVQALVTRRPWWILAAAAACVVAPLVRNQLGLIGVGAVVAAAVFWFTGAGGRRLRRNWSRWDAVGFALLLVCALAVANAVAAHRSGVWQLTTENHKGRMLRDGLWAAGALTIGVGVLPTIAGLAALVKPRWEPWSPARRAFASVTATMLAAFGVYGAGKAAYVSTLGLTELIERNLIYVAPLLFVGTAIVFEQRRPRLLGVVLATAFALWLVTTTPYHMDIPVFFDAPGLAGLAGLGRDVGLTPAGAKALLVVLALASAVLLVVIGSATRKTASALATTAAALVLVWNVYGELSFAQSSHDVGDSLLSTMPRPLDWLDRAVPSGTRVTYIGQSLDDASDVLQLEFWNRSLQQVWSTDDTAPGPGPTVTPDVVSTDGRLEPTAGVEDVVADLGVTPVGRVIERRAHYGGRGAEPWTLVRVTPPLRLRQSLEGVFRDGWGKPRTALNQFSTRDGGTRVVRVHVSRTGAARLYPATVTVTLGPLVVIDGKPATGPVTATRTARVRNHLDRVFTFRARAPFRVETSVTPFPHDRSSRTGDPRPLGANIEYSVAPTR